MDKNQKEFLNMLQGEEILLLPYGAVMIEGKYFNHNGERYKISDDNICEIINAYKMQEYGTTDMKAIMKMEGF